MLSLNPTANFFVSEKYHPVGMWRCCFGDPFSVRGLRAACSAPGSTGIAQLAEAENVGRALNWLFLVKSLPVVTL